MFSCFRSNHNHDVHLKTMRINRSLIFFIIFVEFVNSDIGIGGHIPDTQRLRHQSSEKEEDRDCDNHSNGECPCAVRDAGQYR